MRMFKRLVQVSIFVTALGLTGCGSSSSTDNSNGGSSPTPAPTATPTPNGSQPNVSCPAHNLAVGDAVAYIGPISSGSSFSDATVIYTGVVKQINQHVLVTWNNPGLGDVAVNSSVIVPKIVCSPDLTGKSVEYIGQQGASVPNFTSTSHVYFGTVVATYSLGYVEVQWNDFSNHTLQAAADVSISQ